MDQAEFDLAWLEHHIKYMRAALVLVWRFSSILNGPVINETSRQNKP